MKKSQLRKIIKESIKQLMTEQSTNARYIRISTCWGANTRYRHATVDGGVPQVGQMIDWTFMNRTWFITAVQTNPWTSPQGIQNIGSYQGTTCCPHLCGTSVNYSATWSPSNPDYGMTGMNNVGCSGNGSMCCGNSNYNASPNSNCPNTSSCDTTPASACATQWFGNTAGNFTAWMASKDCSNYQSVVNNLEPQANALMAAAPTPQPGPYSDWNAIKNAANVSGLGQPQKGQFKRKMAKAMYSQCQIQACSC